MSLKSFIVCSIASKTIEKLASSEKVDDMVNNVVVKSAKSNGWVTNESNFEIKRKYCFIIKSKSVSVNSLKNVVKGDYSDMGGYWGKYKIYDYSKNLKYTTEPKEFGFLSEVVGYDKETLYLFDDTNKIIGSIKENLLSFRIPLLEKDTKRCTLFISNNEFCEIRKSHTFNELYYEMQGCNYSIVHNNEKNIIYNNPFYFIIIRYC